MTQGNVQGLRLRPGDNSRKKNTRWLLETLVCTLASLGLILPILWTTAPGQEHSLIVMTGTALYLCFLYGLLKKSDHGQWFCPGVLVLMLAVSMVCRAQLLEGYRLFWNCMSDAMVRGTGWLLPEWETQLSEKQHTLSLALFEGFLAAFLCLISCTLSAWAPPVLAVLLPTAALGVMHIFGAELPAALLLVVLIAAVLTLLYSGWGSGAVTAPIFRSWMAAGTAAALLFGAASLPAISAWVQGVGTRMQQEIHAYRYETEHTTLPEGDFTRYQKEDKSAETALLVTMETPEMLYLRGFTGVIFQDDAWKPLEREVLVRNKNLLYWLQLQAFHTNAQFDAASAGTQRSVNTITVQNIGACSRYRYVPFGLCAGESLQAEDLNTEGVLSEGERVYTYTAVSGGAEAISQVLQHLQTSEEPEALQYRRSESAYRHFADTFYLQVPEEAKQLLAGQWEEIASGYGGAANLTPQQAQECALVFLSRCFPEGGAPEAQELPLDAAGGTTFQYATVATLTLRYFGIPARYAEGYLITEQMAASAVPGQPVTVDSSCARAWVEVYQDGIGWIPMELTPGLGEILEEDPEDNREKGDGDTENPELDPEEAEEDSPMEEDTEVPDPEGGSVVRILLTLLKSFLWILLILAAIFLLLWLRRRYWIEKNEKRFRSGDCSSAVAWIFADTALLLEQLGLHRENGSMRTLCEPAEVRFGPEFAAKLNTLICLNDRALFSSRPLEETHREAMLSFRLETLQRMKTELKWYRRLWLKWIRCLY